MIFKYFKKINQEYRTIIPNEEERFSLKNILRDVENANARCESDKAELLSRLDKTTQQLASVQGKNGK